MESSAARYGGGFIALAAIWIGVYWLWEPSQNAKVSFASDLAAETRSASDAVPFLQEEQTSRADAGRSMDAKPVADSESKIISGVIPPEYREYTVQKYDTFESISKKFYGTTRYARAIIGANPYVSPTSLQVGRRLRVPIDPENIQGKPVGERTTAAIDPEFAEYVVVKGDTLSEISQRFYGSMRYAKEIYTANISTMKSMDDLHIGQKLRIPSRSRVLGVPGNTETSDD